MATGLSVPIKPQPKPRIKTDLDKDSFHSPEDLRDKYNAYNGKVTPEEEVIAKQGYYEYGSGRKPSYY